MITKLVNIKNSTEKNRNKSKKSKQRRQKRKKELFMCNGYYLELSYNSSARKFQVLCSFSIMRILGHHITFFWILTLSISPFKTNWKLLGMRDWYWSKRLSSMMDCLLAKCNHDNVAFWHLGTVYVTDCVMAELEKLGPKFRIALRFILLNPRLIIM